jgi:hypothetical protein
MKVVLIAFYLKLVTELTLCFKALWIENNEYSRLLDVSLLNHRKKSKLPKLTPQ